MKPTLVGILGCGAIAPAYLENLFGPFAGRVAVAACADVRLDAANRRAKEFGVPRACTVEELLADPAIELVINLTPAPVHYSTNLAILRAGKHVFSEKPLALSREHASELLHEAESRGRHVAGAADPFLGASLQRARKLIDAGDIGVPIGAHGVVALNQRNSRTYHQVFRGPLLDMGPYYLTALVALLGPVARVSGSAEIRFAEKADPSLPSAESVFKPDVASTVSASLTFRSGEVAALLLSCDVDAYYPRLEIHGTEGSLQLNDANFYGGKVVLTRRGKVEVFETSPGFSAKGRGLGVFEMAQALEEGRVPRAHGGLMYHVLDTMLSVIDSSATGRRVDLASTASRPAPFEYAL